MNAKRISALTMVWLLLGALAACAPSMRLYVNPDADLAFYKKIAVLPFNDISGSSLSAPRVTRAFVTEQIPTNRYQIVQPEELVGVLIRMRINPTNGVYDPAQLKDAAAQMGLQGILRGTVTEYQMSRDGSGEIPVIGFDAEMIDVGTGNVVWRSSISKRGKGRISILGSGSRSLGKLSQDACAVMVAHLRKGAL